MKVVVDLVTREVDVDGVVYGGYIPWGTDKAVTVKVEYAEPVVEVQL